MDIVKEIEREWKRKHKREWEYIDKRYNQKQKLNLNYEETKLFDEETIRNQKYFRFLDFCCCCC